MRLTTSTLAIAAMAAFSSFAAPVVRRSDQGVTNFGGSDPLITFNNTAGQDRVYMIQTNSDNPSTAYGVGMQPIPSLTVPAGSVVQFHPGTGLVGAFSGMDGSGTRHEVNFRDPSTTWYNADMEFGMSNSTFGTTDGSKRIDGGDSTTGESDCLGKANAVWGNVDANTQQVLLDSGFVQGATGGNGALTAVSMSKQATAEVVKFFQITAEFNSYVDPGSIDGAVPGAMAKIADKKTLSVATNKLTITSFD